MRETLEATAAPPTDGSPFWQMGYGVADAPAALEMVQGPRFKSRLRRAHAAADERVLGGRDWHVDASEHWTWMPPAATVAGIPDSRDLTLPVPAGTDALKVAASGPRFPAGVTLGGYSVTVLDAAGQEVGRTAPPRNMTLIDLRGTSPAFGDWTLHVEGVLASNDDSVHQRVTVVATLLEAQVEVPSFVALALTPDPGRTTGASSPEGCEIEPGEPRGTLAPPPVEGICHSAQVAATGVDLAEFTSAPFEQERVLAGEGRLVLHISDPATPRDPLYRTLDYQFDELTADGGSFFGRRFDVRTVHPRPQ